MWDSVKILNIIWLIKMPLGPQTLELSPIQYCVLLEKSLKTYISKLWQCTSWCNKSLWDCIRINILHSKIKKKRLIVLHCWHCMDNSHVNLKKAEHHDANMKDFLSLTWHLSILAPPCWVTKWNHRTIVSDSMSKTQDTTWRIQRHMFIILVHQSRISAFSICKSCNK